MPFDLTPYRYIKKLAPGEIKIYKKGSSYTGDTGDMDFSAKNMAELKDKLRRLGANPSRPSTGNLS